MYFTIENPEQQINFSGTGISNLYRHVYSPGSVTIPEQFHMDSPYNLLFYTYHPAEAAPQLMIYQATPGQSVYTLYEGNEVTQILSRLALHQHDYYELVFVIEGEIYQNIEHTRHLYPKGSCCLLNKNVRHTEEYTVGHRICFLQFSSDMISHLLCSPCYFQEEQSDGLLQMQNFFHAEQNDSLSRQKNYMDFIPLHSESWIHEHVHRRFDLILQETGNPHIGSSLRVSSLLLELLCCLFDSRHYQHTPIYLGSQKERNLFDAITSLFRKQHGRIGRKELEKELNYSGDYLYKIVQKYTGLSLFEYGMHFCLKEAAELLSSTNLPVQEIARKLQFTNMTHFYRLFEQEYHMTPKEFRKQRQGGIP